MVRIKIIRAALREIQKLPHSACENIYEILRSLSEGLDIDTLFLESYKNLRLLRTKKGKLRVIWKRDDGGDILVIRAGWRDKAYTGDLTNKDLENQELIYELESFKKSQISEIELSEHPAYNWNPYHDSEWYKYLYGNYRYSPILTSYQRQELEEFLYKISTYSWNQDNHQFSDKACIVQSAPGTGKTVCAALLACEIQRERGWNIILIVPDALRRDIAEYREVKQALEENNFWLVTFKELLVKLNTEFTNNLASPEEELTALKKVAHGSHLKLSDLREISYRDVLLYQSFILDEENKNERRNAIFTVNQKRINDLQKISYSKWLQALKGKKSRIEAAFHLRDNIPEFFFNSPNTLIIVDEAQDLMLCELQALIETCQEWNKQQNLTHLWLLGDLNQRIQPTDFDWGQLHLGKQINLRRNYRNSTKILEFANQFLNLAEDINKVFKGKYLPQATHPEYALEIGDNVRILKCESKEDAVLFLQKLAQQDISEENKRYLLRDLANAIKVITNHNLDIDNENLIILTAENAKGREFEACVACGLFIGTAEPSLEEAFQWYTLLTRARSRLLVVLTPEEINRLNFNQEKDYFANCLANDAQSAINWISELASDVDVSKTPDFKKRLLKRCETGRLYWDTYSALELAGIEGDELYQWEREAISHLRKHSDETLKSELNCTQKISLRCLLWRTMEFSWQAVKEATQLENNDFKEYERLLNSIARDLEAKGLTYEAARVKARLNDNQIQPNFPFWEEINQKSNSSQSLITLLCEAFASRIENIFEAGEINQ